MFYPHNHNTLRAHLNSLRYTLLIKRTTDLFLSMSFYRRQKNNNTFSEGGTSPWFHRTHRSSLFRSSSLHFDTKPTCETRTPSGRGTFRTQFPLTRPTPRSEEGNQGKEGFYRWGPTRWPTHRGTSKSGERAKRTKSERRISKLVLIVLQPYFTP